MLLLPLRRYFSFQADIKSSLSLSQIIQSVTYARVYVSYGNGGLVWQASDEEKLLGAERTPSFCAVFLNEILN